MGEMRVANIITNIKIKEKMKKIKPVKIKSVKGKEKIIFENKVYYNPEMIRRTNPIRVSRNTGLIQVNPKNFDKLPDEFKYWLIRWAKHCFEISKKGEGNAEAGADVPATKDYLGKGYPKKLLLKYFIKMLSNSHMDMNTLRISAMIKGLKKDGRKK
jgi:hypothetical protein